ncbi:MAG TPA: TVP38/TMEM64 family protein [Syntrophorhabdaceae bacterium]|nr:TVP38/TMEM64 family protein [Syntrophorhabdaceae bacterium]
MKKDLTGKLFLLALIISVIVVFRVFDLGGYFTLTYLKDSLQKFKSLYLEHRALFILSYFGIYVIAASLSLPGAAVLTVFGGALFGFIVGTLIVSFASTIGATLACLVARYLLGNWVQTRFGERIRKINEGIAEEGPFYLFTLRLIPIFPFWLINLAMGMTRIRLWTFYWVSQLGMLGGTMVYVNAGREIAELESVRQILSPGLLVALALLGTFPLVTKKLLTLYRRKKSIIT